MAKFFCAFKHRHGITSAIITLSSLPFIFSCSLLSAAAEPVMPAKQIAEGEVGVTAGGASDTQATKMLKGEVGRIDLALESLQEVGLDIKRLRGAASNLYDEVTIKPVSYSMPPNVIGNTVINIPIHVNTSAMGLPRPKWVKQCMSDIEPTIRLLKQDVDAVLSGEKEINMPPDALAVMQPLFKDWVAIVNNLDGQLNQLTPLTQAAPYDNGSIASVVGQIVGDGRKLEITRKKMYKALQREAKAAKQRAKGKR